MRAAAVAYFGACAALLFGASMVGEYAAGLVAVVLP